MIEKIKNIIRNYENTDIESLSTGNKARYNLLKNYLRNEQSILKEYNKRNIDIEKVKSLRISSMQSSLRNYQKKAMLYLKYSGLDTSTKALNNYSDKVNNKFQGIVKKVQSDYEESKRNLENSYQELIDSNYESYQKTEFSKQYFDKLQDESIAKKVNNNMYSIGGKSYELDSVVSDNITNTSDFLHAVKNHGFIAVNDIDIPDGFFIELKKGIFNKNVIYLYSNGKWYNVK